MKHLLACVWLVLCAPVLANIGSVTEHTGVATIKRGKDTITVSRGTVVEQNDKVETRNGRVKIVFRDDTQVSVTEQSTLVIDDFVYDPNTRAGKLGLKAAAGTVRYVSGAIAKDPKAVNIKTPTAAIAVRGTDFVMSVNETGASMVILMPTCDWATSAVKGLVCGSGAIQVESGTNIVNLNRPYQATLVETAGQPPSPPITVNLFNTPVGNNLQISPPRTMSGANVVAAARAAVADTTTGSRGNRTAGASPVSSGGDSGSSSADPVASQEVAAVTATDASESTATVAAEEKTTTAVEAPAEPTVAVVTTTVPEKTEEKITVVETVTVTDDSKREDPNLRKIYTGASQSGWGYETLGRNSRNYANVVLPVNTQVMISITQDMITNAYSFAGRPSGQIVIRQTYR